MSGEKIHEVDLNKFTPCLGAKCSAILRPYESSKTIETGNRRDNSARIGNLPASKYSAHSRQTCWIDLKLWKACISNYPQTIITISDDHIA